MEREKTRLLRAQLRQVRTREQLQAREIHRLRKARPPVRRLVYRERIRQPGTTGKRVRPGTGAGEIPAQVPEEPQLYVVRFTVLPHDQRPSDYRGIASIALRKPWRSMSEEEQRAVLSRVGGAVRSSEGQNTWLDRVRYTGRLPEHERKVMEERGSNVLLSWTG